MGTNLFAYSQDAIYHIIAILFGILPRRDHQDLGHIVLNAHHLEG